MKSKKETIKEHAAGLFRAKGYSATSMKDISLEVGMEAASLYNHIQSKQELLSDLLLSIAQKFTKGMDEIKNTSLNAEEKIEKLVALHVRLAVENTNEVALVISEWVHLQEPYLSEYLKMRNSYEEDFRVIMDACIKQGLFKPVNTDIALFSILSTLRWLYSWYAKNKKISPVELEKQMILCLIDGLKA